MEFGFEDIVGQVERLGGDALEQLNFATAKSKEVSAIADALLDHFVQKGREAGLTWAQIGEVLNVSKQAAQQRSTRLLRNVSHSVLETVRSSVGPRGGLARFTDKGRAALEAAEDAARTLSHDEIGTEHLLMGLYSIGGVGSQALAGLGLTPDEVTKGVEERVGRGATASAKHISFTRRAKTTLELSLREARQMGHNYIGTEHLALALARGDEDSIARQILVEAGITQDALRVEIIRVLEDRRGPGQGESGVQQA